MKLFKGSSISQLNVLSYTIYIKRKEIIENEVINSIIFKQNLNMY